MSKQWIQVIQLVAIPKDDVVAVNAGGREIALYSVDGEVYATDNACSHGNARLCDGFLDGHEIECPLHQGKFDVRTGRAMCEPLTSDIEVFGVRVENGEVFVEV
ncbi:non-heme iron oxygenase ferredoxin subunit [Cupriavidus basilensis]|uniref:Non-heme iron oxygenase ferredoxin subunit n=1 Tax=Cupriavidus basilensis TaxID=68895 RepID=A0A643FYE6_9BURK|nr:non-heme iron oxygenase ferredoxin subunit [Cupriavidus basilensis]MCP3019872.1 non-heme iron oxygenase ferredoxin subunit [Cupriavidus basilensis]QOT80538.1 non-heme iron oxygenase ferredoxin subunit [Cupriavidus basilensis]